MTETTTGTAPPAAPPAPPVPIDQVPSGTPTAEQAGSITAAKEASQAIWPTQALSRDDALAKIAKLKANREWTGKYLAGDAGARKEMLDPVKIGHGTPEADAGEFAKRLATLQTMGLNLDGEAGKDIIAVLKGAPISPEIRRQVEARRTALMRDPGFVNRYQTGDLEARRTMTTIAILMSANIERKTA
jgi:hypothetical protein